MPLALLILAQADAPPADFGPWLANVMYLILSAAGVVGLLVGVKMLRESPAETPNPLTVRTEPEWATKAQLTEVHGRIKRERAEIDAHFARIETASMEATRRVDHELHAIRDSIEASKEAGEERVEGLRRKIDEQTGLIISVIRKEGAGR